MSLYDEVGEGELTHMLGYVPAKAWAGALADKDHYKRDVILMIIQQERIYDYDLMEDILNILEYDLKDKAYRDTIETVYRETIYELQDRGYDVEVRL